MFEKWEETLSKVDDETIKKVFINFGNQISDLSALRCHIIEILPDKEGLRFMGYEDIDQLKAEIQDKADEERSELNKKTKPTSKY